MKLTPIDIQQQEFRRRMRGVDPREVRNFLELVAQHMGEISRENDQLSTDLKRSQYDVEAYRSRETTLNEAMLTAQRAIDEIRQQGEKESELLIADAEVRADRLIYQAQKRADEILDDIRNLKEQRTRALEELRCVLNSHQKIINLYEDVIDLDSNAYADSVQHEEEVFSQAEREDTGGLSISNEFMTLADVTGDCITEDNLDVEMAGEESVCSLMPPAPPKDAHMAIPFPIAPPASDMLSLVVPPSLPLAS